MDDTPVPISAITPRVTRPLPTWTWLVLALALFPSGVFIGLGLARVLTWPRSIALALFSEVTVVGFALAMSGLEENHAREMWRLAVSYGGIGMFAAWNYVIYCIGRRAAYWSPKVMRSWRRAAWILGTLFLLLGSLTVALKWANHSLRDSAGFLHNLWLRQQK